MQLIYSPTPPAGTKLTVRVVTEDAFANASGIEAFLSASAKTAGGLAFTSDGQALVGVGNGKPKGCLTAGRKLAAGLAEAGAEEVHVDLGDLNPDAALAFLRGLHVGGYQLGQWRGEGPKAPPTLKLSVSGSALRTSGEQVLAKAEALAAGQMAAMHLVDRPANAKKPEDVASYVEALGKEHGFAVETLDEEALEVQGWTGVLSVGRASAYPPRVLKLSYEGGDAYHLGLVGKGITFDTGGISIKPSQNMGFMKSDLGGAAAVLGAFVATAKLGLPVKLHGILCVAENAVSGDAYLPSDVIRNYSGKTIEIVDTDAEGRLVMADALAYFPEWQTPDLTMDLATLTGSAVRTFGYECAAMFSHDVNVQAAIAEAGEQHGERVWPLPLWEEYEADIKSDVADVKHFHGKPIAGAINAAKFLEFFVADKARWAHLDIAGVAFGANEFAKDRSATGYGVALLTQFLIDKTDG